MRPKKTEKGRRTAYFNEGEEDLCRVNVVRKSVAKGGRHGGKKDFYTTSPSVGTPFAFLWSLIKLPC